MRVGPILAGAAALAALVAGVTLVPAGGTPVAFAAPSAAPRSAADGILGSFSPLGNGVSQTVFALVNADDSLYVGGDFGAPTGSSTAKVAVWGPLGSADDTWQSTGANLGQIASVQALAVKANTIVAGGFNFSLADCCIAARQGGTWGPLGSGVGHSTFAVLLATDDSVYVGGRFTGPGNAIARWNGSTWGPLGSGMNNYVLALAMDPAGVLFAGGMFTTAGGASADRVASWNGTTWSALGSGMNASVNALAQDPGSGRLYAAGGFSTAGDSSANGIASWDGSAWAPLGGGLYRAGGGVEASALALDRAHGILYVAGRFDGAGGVTTAFVAAWDLATQQWIPLRWGISANEAGLNERAFALAVDDSTVFVGGAFTGPAGETWNGCTAGGTLRCIAKWTWEPPQGSNSLTGTAGSQITITGEGFIGVPTTGGVKIDGTPVTYTRTSTTSITATAPAGYLNGATISVNGVGGWGDVGTFSTYVPPPPPAPIVYPPSPPSDVTATAGDAQASVSWQPPSSQGTFPITSYQVESIPAGGSCVATSLTCDVTGLTNGTPYAFRVRAISAAGSSDWSALSNEVTPKSPAPPPPPPTPSIVITGSRGAGTEARTVYVDGTAMHLASQQVQAWVRLAGQSAYRQGITVPVGSDSRFSWKRVTGKKVYVYFMSGDVRSNRVVISSA